MGRIHKSREALSVRIETKEQRRYDRSSNCSHRENEGGRRNVDDVGNALRCACVCSWGGAVTLSDVPCVEN